MENVMNYNIDRQGQIPAYIQLYKLIVSDIVTGTYQYGSKLPSKRTVAAETELSLITVEHAYALLCDEGYIQSRQRSGYFVIYKKSDFRPSLSTDNSWDQAKYKFQEKNNSAITTSGYKGEFPFSVLSKTMRKVLTDYDDELLIKSPNAGCLELREEICAYIHRSRGIIVSPNQVIIGSGAEYLYGLIAQYMGPDTLVAIEDPSYEKIRMVYESLGLKCDLLPLSSSGIPADKLDATAAKVLHVTPFNSFPSGVTIDISKKLEYLKWAQENEKYIVEDNYDSELTVSRKVEDSLFALSDNANVIYLNTFSKTIAPSMRIGYMLLPESMVENFEKKLGFYSCPVALFEQYVLASLLRNGDFERHINRIRRKKRKNQGN